MNRHYTDTMTDSTTQTDSAPAEPAIGPTDTQLPGLLRRLPPFARPYALLARLDRPVGIWLLYLPCLIGLAQMRLPTGFQWADIGWALLFLIGAIAMRGAGCTWNDISDREVDAQVARTSGRPLPAGLVTLNQAYMFLAAQLAVGFLVWLALPWTARIIALLAIPLVAAYPYMKRITWWPQAWLGFTFNWGALVGGAVAFGGVTSANFILYLGLIAWTVAYDTIYAMQDVEDDALIGVKSTARLFADRVLAGIFSFQLIATLLIALGLYFAGASRIGALTALFFLAHGFWQTYRLNTERKSAALDVFKSNVQAGLILLIGTSLAVLI